MKKTLTLVLALIMVCVMSVTVFAETIITDVAANNEAQGTVVLTITGEGTQTTSTVYSVNVIWTDATLEYDRSKATQLQWNPETHQYDISAGAESGWIDGSFKVQVTNHSNARVTATLGLPAAAAIHGVVLTPNATSVTLDNAETASLGNPSGAPTTTFTVNASNFPANGQTSFNIHTSVTITAAN